MNDIVKKFKRKIMEQEFRDEFPQLVKCLLFSKYLDIEESERKLFMNFVYQNREKLDVNSKKYYDYYVRKEGFYSHSLLKKGNFSDVIYSYDNLRLSNKQFELLEYIDSIEKEYNFVSAPTSFGKSKIIFDYMIKRHSKLVIIVPTKALINEYKSNIASKEEDYEVTSNPTKDFSKLEKYIFICTQERLNISNCSNPEMIIVDEAQEVGNINDPRTIEMVFALRRFEAKKIFISPYIDVESLRKVYEIILNKNFECQSFMATEMDALVSKINYYVKDGKKNILLKYAIGSELIVRKIPKSEKKSYSKMELCIKVLEIEKKNCGKNIFYLGSKNRVMSFAQMLEKKAQLIEQSSTMKKLINYFTEEYSKDFVIIDYLKRGILIHTADIDPFARRIIEKIYNTEVSANNLIATSTIAAGVNLECENLFYIYKRIGENIAQTKNILGRSGRFEKYNVGTNYHFEDKKNDEIVDSEVNNDKIVILNPSDYEVDPSTEIHDDLEKNHDEKISVFKYYVSTKYITLLSNKLLEISSYERNEIYRNPLKFENLELIFKLYFSVVEPNEVGMYKYFAVIFTNYMSGKSYKRLVQEDLSKGVYYCHETNNVSYTQNSEVEKGKLKKYTKENVTKEVENFLIFKKIRDNIKYCEFKLKRVITIILYLIHQIDALDIEELNNMYLNLEFDVDNNEKRVIIQKLADLGLEDKFIVNKILADKDLQKKVLLCEKKVDIQDVFVEYFGVDSHYTLPFDV